MFAQHRLNIPESDPVSADLDAASSRPEYFDLPRSAVHREIPGIVKAGSECGEISRRRILRLERIGLQGEQRARYPDRRDVAGPVQDACGPEAVSVRCGVPKQRVRCLLLAVTDDTNGADSRIGLRDGGIEEHAIAIEH